MPSLVHRRSLWCGVWEARWTNTGGSALWERIWNEITALLLYVPLYMYIYILIHIYLSIYIYIYLSPLCIAAVSGAAYGRRVERTWEALPRGRRAVGRWGQLQGLIRCVCTCGGSGENDLYVYICHNDICICIYMYVYIYICIYIYIYIYIHIYIYIASRTHSLRLHMRKTRRVGVYKMLFYFEDYVHESIVFYCLPLHPHVPH